jgi:hypothetical protein
MSEVKTEEIVSDEPTMEEVAGASTEEVVGEVEAKPETLETEVVSEVDLEVDPLINQEKVQEKINKVIAEKGREKRRADELEAKLKAIEASKKPLPTEAPQLEEFDYDDDKHRAAVIQYEIQKALETQQQLTKQQQEAQALQKIADDFTSKEAEYLAKHPEYSTEVANLPRFGTETLNAIYELGPQVSHYLAKHLDVASEVANASPTMAAVKLGQISMGLSGDNKTVKPTTAPEPPTTLKGGATISKAQEDMSMDEIMALP